MIKVFLESFNFSSVRETGANLFDSVQKSIALDDERCGAKIYAVLTDNASKKQNMGADCQALGLFYSTCNAHSANLLAGEILKSSKYKKTMKQVKSVKNWFSKPIDRCWRS